MIGVKFMLKEGHYLTVVTDRFQLDGIRKFFQQSNDHSGVVLAGKCLVTDIEWQVPLGNIIGIHTVDAEHIRLNHLQTLAQVDQLRQQLGSRPASPWFGGKSGIG